MTTTILRISTVALVLAGFAAAQDHTLGYELMKRTSAVLIERLQATRRQLLKQAGTPPP